MTTEEKFHAAVNVIRSLPKNGAYQPSHELKLRFYAYFKQATEGPCTGSKPGFWDVVGRVKWEAWKKLGNMSKEDAMNNYVEELKKIVETMSYNANVETFLGSLGNFYDTVPAEDLEMLLGPVIERVRSQPGSPLKGSPLASRETSPSRVGNGLVSNPSASSLETSPITSMTPSPYPPDSDDDEFIDTVETTPYSTRKDYKSLSNSPTMTKRALDLKEDVPVKENGHAKNYSPKENGHLANGSNLAGANGTPNGVAHQINGNGFYSVESDDESLSYSSTRTRIRDKDSPSASRRRVMKQNGGPKNGTTNYVTDVSEPIREAVLHLQKDLDRINARIRTLEKHVLSQPLTLQLVELCEKCCENVDEEIVNYEDNIHVPVSDHVPVRKSWWPLVDITPRTALFVVVWPIVAHFLMIYIQQRRNRI
ncbi:UNVERIFIED_CONTAM: hypothetical protein PYX00_010322 [Menopon gallinae]